MTGELIDRCAAICGSVLLLWISIDVELFMAIEPLYDVPICNSLVYVFLFVLLLASLVRAALHALGESIGGDKGIIQGAPEHAPPDGGAKW